MSKLIEKFNEKTSFEFDYLKLSFVNVYVKKAQIEICLIYPEDKEYQIKLANEKIISSLTEILKSNADIIIRLRKSHYDKDFFIRDLFSFLKKFPSISNTISDKDISILEMDNKVRVTLILEKSVFDYCVDKNIANDIEIFIDQNYCENIKVNFEFFVEAREEHLLQLKNTECEPEILLDDPNGRFIRPENVEEFIGRIVYDKAAYISDAKKPAEEIVLCGKISYFEELTRKPKEGVPADKKYYKFILEDFTGSVSCIYFPSKKFVDTITLLKNGKEVTIRGKLDIDTYKKDGSMTFNARDISLCTLPTNFIKNEARRQVDREYKYVSPKKYIKLKQDDLFTLAETVPKNLIGKTYCVFDIETTGLNPVYDKIIEIGAVKIIDGKVTETFSSFINPQIPIPSRITELTHITDSDVENALSIEQVLPDFYKFSDKTILVGQNISFDYSFISDKGAGMKIFFENEKLDTLTLARKYIKKLRNYKLGTIAESLNIVNEGEHRAIFDAIATAEIFLKIAKMIP